MQCKNEAIIVTTMMAYASRLEPFRMLSVLGEIAEIDRIEANKEKIVRGRIAAEMIAVSIVNRYAMNTYRWMIGKKDIVLFVS